MSDELHNFLMSGSGRHANLSAESLELMGKEAANMYLNQGVSLNEGLAKLAGAHDDINAEQIKRVAEYANTAVYLALHDKNKTAGANSSYPQFDLADPGRIIQDLSDGARPTIVTPTDIEYGRQPEKKAKVASAQADILLSQMFGYEGAEKCASSDRTSNTTVAEVMSTKDTLLSLQNHHENAASQLNAMYKEASDQYYDLVKTHLLEGESFADVMVAAKSTGASDVKIAHVIGPVVERLVLEKIASPKRLQGQVQGFEKVAHRVVNEKHPLVTTFGALVELDDHITKVATALVDTKEQLGVVNSFIKEQFRAGTAR